VHEAWHIVVLVSALLGAAAAVVVAAVPLIFESPPPGLRRLRPLVLGLVGLSIALVLVEWLWVH
jgi:hypothetical protein